MRSAERRLFEQPRASERARRAVDARRLEGGVELERRQDSRQSAREQRLAASWRTDQQQVVRAGGGDLERALRALLAVHLGEVGETGASVAAPRERAERLERFAVAKPAQHGAEVGGAVCLDARPERRLGQVLARHDDFANRSALDRAEHRQHAAHGAESGVEAELAHEQRSVQPRFGKLDARAGDADRDRQIERRADLRQPCRRQIHRHTAGRELETGVAERGANPIAALVHHAVGLADDVERGQSRAGFDLDRDADSLDHMQGRAVHAQQHADLARDRETVPLHCRARAWKVA